MFWEPGVQRRHELSDEQWLLIEAVLPPKPTRGRPTRCQRQVIDGMVWILMTGAAWRDLPERFGPWKTIYHNFNKWSKDGTIQRIAARLRTDLDRQGRVGWDLWCIDGTVVRASRAAAGALKKRRPTNPLTTPSDTPVAATPPRST